MSVDYTAEMSPRGGLDRFRLKRLRGEPRGPGCDVRFGPMFPNVLVLEPGGAVLAFRCATCGGEPARAIREGIPDLNACPDCDDVGFIGIDPLRPIVSPDSATRAACKRARYVAGLPLVLPGDSNGLQFRSCDNATCDQPKAGTVYRRRPFGPAAANHSETPDPVGPGHADL